MTEPVSMAVERFVTILDEALASAVEKNRETTPSAGAVAFDIRQLVMRDLGRASRPYS